MTERPAQPEAAAAGGVGVGVADVVIGSAVAMMASSNLVQGMWNSSPVLGIWAQQLPWLNLTVASMIVVAPAALYATTRRLSLSALGAVLLLSASLLLGYFEPAVSANAGDKRAGMVFAVLFVLVAAMLTLTNRRRVSAFLATIVVLGSLVLLGQALIPDPLALLTGRRTPIGQNAIGTGRIVGAALVIIAAAVFRQARARSRLLLLIVAVPFALGLVAAGSRGPIVGLVVAVLFLLWVQPGIRGATKTVALAVVLAAAWTGFHFLSEQGSRVGSGSGSGRWQLYGDAVQVALAHPWGVGWGNFSRYASSSEVANKAGELLYAHNIFLEFWLETGVLGVLLFSVFVVLTTRAALADLSSPLRVALTALALNLMAGAMFSSEVTGNRLMWATFGALLAGAVVARVDRRSPEHATRRAGTSVAPRPRSDRATASRH